LTLETIDFEE